MSQQVEMIMMYDNPDLLYVENRTQIVCFLFFLLLVFFFSLLPLLILCNDSRFAQLENYLIMFDVTRSTSAKSLCDANSLVK